MMAREKTERKVEVVSEREREEHNNLLYFQNIIRIILKKMERERDGGWEAEETRSP